VRPAFGDFAHDVIAAVSPGWRNEKHHAQWSSTIKTYCAPPLAKPIDEITTENVHALLSPIWTTKADTAHRVRGRIEKILNAAEVKGYSSGENPALWRGHLDHILSSRLKLRRGHHCAMHWRDLPQFVSKLRQRKPAFGQCRRQERGRKPLTPRTLAVLSEMAALQRTSFIFPKTLLNGRNGPGNVAPPP
jgi:hypothetical protein